MSLNEDKKAEQSPDDASSGLRDKKTQYEETTTFSDPLPLQPTSGASDSDEDGQLLKKNPFLDPDVAEHWSKVYEKARYECRHEFDPSFNWSSEEEKKLVHRLDWHVCLWAVSLLPKLNWYSD